MNTTPTSRTRIRGCHWFTVAVAFELKPAAQTKMDFDETAAIEAEEEYITALKVVAPRHFDEDQARRASAGEGYRCIQEYADVLRAKAPFACNPMAMFDELELFEEKMQCITEFEMKIAAQRPGQLVLGQDLRPVPAPCGPWSRYNEDPFTSILTRFAGDAQSGQRKRKLCECNPDFPYSLCRSLRMARSMDVSTRVSVRATPPPFPRPQVKYTQIRT